MEILRHILDYWVSGGVLLVPLAIVSFLIWFHFLRMRQALLAAIRLPDDFEHNILAACGSPMLIPSAVEYAIGEAKQGRDAEQAFEDYRAAAEKSLHRNLVILAALTAAAPLIGLLGTVMGMIGTFEAVTRSTTVQGGAVAAGISQALITTQFGLIIALPGVFGVARLHRLLNELRIRFAVCRSHFLLACRGGGPA